MSIGYFGLAGKEKRGERGKAGKEEKQNPKTCQKAKGKNWQTGQENVMSIMT